jgi:hypothetical protein
MPGVMADSAQPAQQSAGPEWIYDAEDGWVWHVADNGQNLSVYDRRINASGYTETEQILWFEFKYNSVSGTQTRWGFARGATLVIYDAETNAMIHHSATDGTVNNRQLEAGKWYRILLMPDANAQLGANREIGYAGGYYNEGNVDIYIRNVHSNDKH